MDDLEKQLSYINGIFEEKIEEASWSEVTREEFFLKQLLDKMTISEMSDDIIGISDDIIYTLSDDAFKLYTDYQINLIDIDDCSGKDIEDYRKIDDDIYELTRQYNSEQDFLSAYFDPGDDTPEYVAQQKRCHDLYEKIEKRKKDRDKSQRQLKELKGLKGLKELNHKLKLSLEKEVGIIRKEVQERLMQISIERVCKDKPGLVYLRKRRDEILSSISSGELKKQKLKSYNIR